VFHFLTDFIASTFHKNAMKMLYKV